MPVRVSRLERNIYNIRFSFFHSPTLGATAYQHIVRLALAFGQKVIHFVIFIIR